MKNKIKPLDEKRRGLRLTEGYGAFYPEEDVKNSIKQVQEKLKGELTLKKLMLSDMGMDELIEHIIDKIFKERFGEMK